MLRRNNHGLPEAKGSDGRTALYAMDDLTRWWHSARFKRAPDEPAPDALWSLRARRRHLHPGRGRTGDPGGVGRASRLPPPGGNGPTGHGCVPSCTPAARGPAGKGATSPGGRERVRQLHRGLDVLVRNVERDRADLLRLSGRSTAHLDERAGTALTLTPDELFEEVLRRTGTTPVFGRSTMTSASLADAIAAVAAVERRQRVLDPASGEGSLLLSVARSAPSALLEGRGERTTSPGRSASYASNSTVSKRNSRPCRRSAGPHSPGLTSWCSTRPSTTGANRRMAASGPLRSGAPWSGGRGAPGLRGRPGTARVEGRRVRPRHIVVHSRAGSAAMPVSPSCSGCSRPRRPRATCAEWTPGNSESAGRRSGCSRKETSRPCGSPHPRPGHWTCTRPTVARTGDARQPRGGVSVGRRAQSSSESLAPRTPGWR